MNGVKFYKIEANHLTLRACALLRQMVALEETVKDKKKGFVVPLTLTKDSIGAGAVKSAGIDEFSACFYQFQKLTDENYIPVYESVESLEGAAAGESENQTAVIRVRLAKENESLVCFEKETAPLRLLRREGSRKLERERRERKEKEKKAEAEKLFAIKGEVEANAKQTARNCIKRSTDALAAKLEQKEKGLKSSVFALVKSSVASDLETLVNSAIAEFAKSQGIALKNYKANADFTKVFEKLATAIGGFIADDYKIVKNNVKTLVDLA